jgi:diguanylate cyclase (GGDEF)-like protein
METVLTITRKKNCDDFRTSLIETVMALLPTQELAFLRPSSTQNAGFLLEEIGAQRSHGTLWQFNGGGGTRCRSLSSSARRALSEHRHVEERDPASGDQIHYVPIIIDKRPPEILLFRISGEDAGDTPMVLAFSQLYRNFLSLISEGERDALTGLLNRKTLETSIRRILDMLAGSRIAGAQPGTPERRIATGDYWLGVVDIDHFKRVNDNFGHLYGDEVLLLVSQIMQRSFRSDDLLFRYGGEEFVVVLSPTSKEEALNAFERFRHNVESHQFPQISRVTISTGVVRFNNYELASSAVGHADQALYYAKQHGRNRVHCYEDLIDAGQIVRRESQNRFEFF